MSQYEMEFPISREAADQINDIRIALEEYSGSLSEISRDVQQGLENETAPLFLWSQIIQERADDMYRASNCLIAAIENYHAAEQLNCERLTDVGSSLEADGFLENDHKESEFHSQPVTSEAVVRWDNSPAERPLWEDLSVWADWRTLWPLLAGVFVPTGHNAGGIWQLIRAFLNNKAGGDESKDVARSVVSSDVMTGAGVIALPENPFTEAESDVYAKMARGIGDVAGTDMEQRDMDERYDEPLFEPVLHTEPTLEKDKSEPILSKVSSDVATEESSDVYGPQYVGPIASGTVAKTGDGMSAPLIGVTSAASIAVSGLGLTNKLRGDGPDAGETELPEPPFVSAKESGGIFSGNLKGEYVLLSSTLSLLFSGISLAAGVRTHKAGRKRGDLFRIGNGVSALLSGGAIQERS